jgi:hypothetical protein
MSARILRRLTTMNRIGLGLIFFGLTSFLSAQIMNQTDIPQQPALPQGPAGIVPQLKVGVQTVDAVGYNLNTGASGMSYDTANANQQLNTMAYFDILFVDSRSGQPLVYETGTDPSIWSAHFKITNFTARINTGDKPAGLELDAPTWLAELQGHGFRFGMFSQGGTSVQASGSNNNPAITLNGANEVLNLNAGSDYIVSYGSSATPSPNSVAFYGSGQNKSGILYAGYGAPGVFDAYLSALAQGDVNSDPNAPAASRAQGWAFAFNGRATPFGEASASQPLALTLKADAIKGFNFTNNASGFSRSTANLNEGDTAGFGLAGQLDYWAGKDFLISPMLAFDGRLNDASYSTRADSFEWETGGGVLLTLSPKKFVHDDWNELANTVSTLNFNEKIQKFAYVQVLGMYSQATDADLALKGELPVAVNSYDPNLDTMLEYRVYDVTHLSEVGATTWTLTGRVSYDLLDHTLVPYFRWYANGVGLLGVNNTSAVKIRFGAQMALLPGVGIEAAYMSPQLLGSGSTAYDSGKIEISLAMNTDGSPRTLTPKTMNFTDWKTQ